MCHYQIAGICSLDGLLYVCGGYDGASCLSSMERYDPLTGVWSSCPAMATRRRYCRVSSLGAQFGKFLIETLLKLAVRNLQTSVFIPWEASTQATTSRALRGLIRGSAAGLLCPR
jgi:Kelch motif